MLGRQSEVLLDTHLRVDGSRTFDNSGQYAFLFISRLLIRLILSVWCSFILVIVPPFPRFGHSSMLRAVVGAVSTSSPPSLHGILFAPWYPTRDIPTGHAVLASTSSRYMFAWSFPCHHTFVNSSVSSTPALPHPSWQFPDAPRIAIRPSHHHARAGFSFS